MATQKFKAKKYKIELIGNLRCYNELYNITNTDISRFFSILTYILQKNFYKTSYFLSFFRYEAVRMSNDNPILRCNNSSLLGVPIWFLYITPFVKFLQIFNAAINFPIYYFMGTSFRNAFHAMIRYEKDVQTTHNGNGPPRAGVR